MLYKTCVGATLLKRDYSTCVFLWISRNFYKHHYKAFNRTPLIDCFCMQSTKTAVIFRDFPPKKTFLQNWLISISSVIEVNWEHYYIKCTTTWVLSGLHIPSHGLNTGIYNIWPYIPAFSPHLDQVKPLLWCILRNDKVFNLSLYSK